jgi:hypothetical protein
MKSFDGDDDEMLGHIAASQFMRVNDKLCAVTRADDWRMREGSFGCRVCFGRI